MPSSRPPSHIIENFNAVKYDCLHVKQLAALPLVMQDHYKTYKYYPLYVVRN